MEGNEKDGASKKNEKVKAPQTPHGLMTSSKGAPAGANQGGAPRGSSRLEPSHQRDAAKRDHGVRSKGGSRDANSSQGSRPGSAKGRGRQGQR
jgi:hypothetical protein